MRQTVPFYSTRSGNSKLSSFLGIGRFLDLFRRIYYPCTYTALAGGRGEQLYPANSISDFRLVEKHERALIDTPAVRYGVALRESHKTFQAQTSTCIGMRQSVPIKLFADDMKGIEYSGILRKMLKSYRKILFTWNLGAMTGS